MGLSLTHDAARIDVDAHSVSGSFRFVQYVDYAAIPVFLVGSTAAVYSDSEDARAYFVDKLLRYSGTGSTVGMLFAGAAESNYIILYVNQLKLECLALEFESWRSAGRYAAPADHDTVVDLHFKEKSADTAIFDSILQTKRTSTAKKPPAPASVLSTTEQVNSAVSRVVLSGLRLRGLSSSSSSSMNDKLNIKEIYSMTYKATIFALRKYNYSFNGSQGKSLKIDDIQDIVEQLLQIFIDIDQSPFIQT